jgi:hypothetical protein
MLGRRLAFHNLGFAAAIGAWLLTASAFAQAPDESTLAAARQLGQDGVALYERADYAGASDKLERAFAVVRVPTLGLWSGRALEKLGKLVEASQRFQDVTLIELKPGAPAVLRAAQSDARTAYDALAPRIAQLTLELQGAPADQVSVTVDGKAIPGALIGAALPVNPGVRQIEGRLGQEVVGESLTLAEGEHRSYTLVFGAAPATPAPTPAEVATSAQPANGAAEKPASAGGHASILPWVVIGIGGAAAVTGVVFTALALGAKSNVEGAAQGAKWSDIESDYDHVPTFSAVGFTLLGVGAAAVTTGLIWKFGLSDRTDGEMSVEASASRVTLHGSFE